MQMRFDPHGQSSRSNFAYSINHDMFRSRGMCHLRRTCYFPVTFNRARTHFLRPYLVFDLIGSAIVPLSQRKSDK